MPVATKTSARAGSSIVSGTGYVRAVRSRRGTVLTHTCAASPLCLLSPRVSQSTAWVVTATLGGGLVGGDAIDLTIDVGDDARVLVTTQASTKVYRSDRPARQRLRARVGKGALLAWLPDPIIGFAGSTFDQRQRYEIDAHGSLLLVDWLVAGRQASGERWAFDRYASRLEVMRAGEPLFYDHLQLNQSHGAVHERMRQFNAYAVAVAVGPLFEGLATSIVSEIGAQPVLRSSDAVVSAAPLGHAGAILRAAAVSPEWIGTILRERFRPILPLLGDDPWARRW